MMSQKQQKPVFNGKVQHVVFEYRIDKSKQHEITYRVNRNI